jgi:hypothetical protein
MKKEFYIYKEGVTSEKTAIMSKVGEPFDRTAKIQKFLTLGYSVYELDGTEVK